MKHLYILFVLILALLIIPACSENVSTTEDDTFNFPETTEGAVTIVGMKKYFLVTIDYTKETNRKKIGEQYAKLILKTVKDFESRIAWYFFEITLNYPDLAGATLSNRIKEIKANLNPDYVEELEGMVSVMKGSGLYSNNTLVYGYNFIPDICRTTQCNGFGVWGDYTTENKVIAYRTLDWFGGIQLSFTEGDLLSKLQTVTKLIYPNKTVYLFGALGHLGCITGINSTNKIMGAILDAPISEVKYSSTNKSSYNFDLRFALENKSSTDEIANYLCNPDKNYAYNHLILLADTKSVRFLENNISNFGEKPRRELRTDTSSLNSNIVWPYKSIIAAVNCFMLQGQPNNYNQGELAKINVERWKLLTSRLYKTLEARQNKLSKDDVKSIMCSYWGKEPKSLIWDDVGDLYNQESQQMFLYVPEDNYLEIFYKPTDGSTPKDPKPYFFKVDLK